MSLKHGLLGLLNYGTMTGYELDKAFKVSLNFFWQAQTSQIYRELKEMEKCGWLTSEIVYQTEKPNKKLYQLTEEGKTELRSWLLQDSGDTPHSQFLMRIFFAGEIEKNSAIDVLKAFKARNESTLLQLKGTGRNIDKYQMATDSNKTIYWNLAADYGVANAHMCIRWAEEAVKILESIL